MDPIEPSSSQEVKDGALTQQILPIGIASMIKSMVIACVGNRSQLQTLHLFEEHAEVILLDIFWCLHHLHKTQGRACRLTNDGNDGDLT